MVRGSHAFVSEKILAKHLVVLVSLLHQTLCYIFVVVLSEIDTTPSLGILSVGCTSSVQRSSNNGGSKLHHRNRRERNLHTGLRVSNRDFPEDREEQEHGGLPVAAVRDHAAQHLAVDILWPPQARRPPHRHRQRRRRRPRGHLRHALPRLRPERDQGEDGEGGAGRERGRAGGGGGGGAGGAARRRPAVRGRGAVRGAHHRHVRCADGRDEDSGEDEERRVHALLSVLLPLPQRRRLERLLLARQGLLHRNSECNRVRDGDGAAGAVHGVPKEEGGGERRGRGRRRRRGGAGGGAADGAGGDGAGAAEGAAAAQGAEPAQAGGATPRGARPHHQVLLHHPRRAPLHPAPAPRRPPPLRQRPRRRRRDGGGGGRRARCRLRQPVQETDVACTDAFMHYASYSILGLRFLCLRSWATKFVTSIDGPYAFGPSVVANPRLDSSRGAQRAQTHAALAAPA